VFLSSLLGGLVLALQGGMTLAHPVKRIIPRDENTTNRLFEKLLERSFERVWVAIFVGIFI
jgi:hypothetical protein